MKHVSKYFWGLAIILSAITARSSYGVVQTYNNPLQDNLWVDSCMVKYGRTDCSQQARNTIANKWCQMKGAAGYAGWWAGDASGTHETKRYTIWVENAQSHEGFWSCFPCSAHFTRIDCDFPFIN
jgi:hypothetical protein